MNVKFAMNRAFALSEDGWVHLVPVGTHPGQIVKAGEPVLIDQVIDDLSLSRIMADFEPKAKDENFTGLLIDLEHFSHDITKKSEAAGWIKELQRRDDGIWGKVEWTELGQKLIDGKTYKNLSPVLMLEQLSGNRYRPVSLSDAGLTNKPLLKTLVPIQNRDRNMEGAHMDKLRKLLSLSADAAEDQVVIQVQQALNRAAEADALKTRAETAETELKTLKTEALNRDADVFVEKHKDRITDPAKMKALFVANRQAAEDLILLMKEPEKKNAKETRTLNRADGKTPERAADAPESDPEVALNRRREQLDYVEEVKNRRGLPSMAAAWPVAQGLKPELFKEEKAE